MSLAAQHQSVETLFMTAVAAGPYASAPIKFENAPFKQPETPWFALTLLDGNSFSTNLNPGKKIDRHVGIVQVDILVPELTGARLAYLMADWAGGLFRLTTTNLSDGAVVRYRTPAVRSMGCQNGFHRVMVRTTYWRDETAK